MTPISDALKDLLGRQGLTAREGLAGPVARGMKKAGRDSKGAARQVVTDIPREEDTRHRPLLGSVRNPGKLRLVWNMPMRQTTQTPRAVARRGVVSLMVIDGGKR